MAIALDTSLDQIRAKVEAGRAARPRGRARADGVRRPARARRAGRPRPARARRRRPRLLRPEPLLEPDERLPREVQVLRLRRDAEAGARLHEDGRRARRRRRARARADGLHRDPHGQRREPARRPRLLRRHDREAARGASGRGPQVLHGLGDPPHDDALRADPRAGAARAEGRGPGLAPGRRRRDLRRPRAASRRAGQGVGRDVAARSRHRAPAGHPDALHDALRPRRDLRGARSSTCSACATSRTGRAASSRSSRSPSTPRTRSSSAAASDSRPARRT